MVGKRETGKFEGKAKDFKRLEKIKDDRKPQIPG